MARLQVIHYFQYFAISRNMEQRDNEYPQMKRVEDSPRTKWGLLLLVVVFDEKTSLFAKLTDTRTD